ncbi:protein bunched, class 2/F/G isoform-like isoform X1 [Vanessa cardui]|uniref:protein bunched, class 2/F/G isoform-like isoform X1 n=2 Tax=Vanessa cardui TaxID=171605 RepID=UPI001F144CAE|nr:protein bunched, class 2/F/G isoform-like isoform X1 [Vanessa cardui]XP_046966471.1 protein bunched, class 2/F/G isoform-like isoform X1 [Vanessa cardui]
MADNLIQKSHKTSEKNKYNNVVHRTTSESLRLNESEKGVTHPTSLQSAHNPRKISSFQITSVTVGSRVSTDAGEDSADDLDESHTDDISRVTDIENETPSYSEDTFSKDDVFYNASSASLGCAPVIPTSSQYGLAIVGQEPNTNQIGGAVPNSNNTEVNDMHVSVTNAGTGSIINLIGNSKPQEGMKEIQEHVRNERFKVVKIESTEPFRRGRWMCMDYLDHTTTQQNAPITLNNNLEVTDSNTLQAPDSGVVINDSQHDDMCNDLASKGPKDQVNAVQQMDQGVQKQFPMASPGQSLTQPINIVQQQMPVNQSVSVQSPPLEMPQQMPNQTMQTTQQVGQQHPQSMTHITMQNTGQNHPQPPQQQQVQQIPQSFPQHQLQQVIAQSQGIAMQQIPMHQQMPQQMQQIPNQQMQQISQHLPQAQLTNMQIQQQMPQMQGIPNQGQLTQVPGQQPQMQQIQMQPMQGQPNPQQIHQMQQAQIPNIGQGHHLQGQQTMGTQQAQLQHLSSQAQIQALQNQQLPNHIQQMQIPTQLTATNQQISQMQTQMHQLPSQPQQSVVPGIHPQMQQQSMGVTQTQYNQAVNQQANAQSMINATMPSSQQPMVQPQHNVPQYHTQQSQMSQQGQTLPQEVLTSIVTSQQGATLPTNLQPMVTQPQGSTLPANLQSLAGQQQAPVHTMAPQQGNVPQGNIQIMTAPPQSMQMTLDGNQPNMQIPPSDTIYIQPPNVGQQMPTHMTQPQTMLQQQVSGQGQMGGVQYVPNQPVSQVAMTHQNIPMSMQQTMPVGMGGVHANVVQSQTSMAMGYGGVVPVMSQSSVAPVEATVSGTNSPVVSMPVNSTAYVSNAVQPGHDSQGFGSPVSAVVSHAISGAVMSNVNVNACDSGALDVAQDGLQAGDTGDGKEEPQPAPPPEDESISGLALALGGSGTGSPTTAADARDSTATSRAPSPPPSERQQHSSASGTSAVAIDNKIEQAMDLVKSHLMFAVREEVEVLKERIAELMERINQLEVENSYLRAHASQDTLAQLPAAGTKPPPQPQGPQPPVS